MRIKYFMWMLLLLSVQVSAYGQSTLNFPKFFTAAELPNVGFAIVNPGATAATVTFTLYSANGFVLASSQQPIAAAGQLSKLGNELFSNAGTGGWVRATSSVTGLQGFWLIFTGNLTSIDGAEAASAATDLVIPLVAGQTELNVANPNASPVSVTLRLYRSDGQELGTVTQNIVENGVLQVQASTLFQDLLQARYARVTSTGGTVAATAVIKGLVVPNDVGVVNGVDRSSPVTEANFPHVINGILTGAAYTTFIGVTNNSSAPQTVTITFTPIVGVPIPVAQTLAANGSLRMTAQELFNLGAGFQDGWVKVTGSAGLTAFAAYGDTIGGAFAVVPAGTARTQLLFAHIADGPSGLPVPWETGVAFLNTGNTTAVFDVFAMTAAGQLIGSKTGITLEPGKKIAPQLHSWITQVAGVNGGFIFARSNVPLFAIELFYTANVSILSNVSALPLAPGITYTPPTSSGGGGGGGGGVISGSGPAIDCFDRNLYANVFNLHLEYNFSGSIAGTQVSDSVSRLNVAFEGQNTTEISSTSTTNITGQAPSVVIAKSYAGLDGNDLLSYGGTSDITSPVVGSIKSVNSPPARDRRYSLALGDSATQTYSVTTTTSFTGFTLPPTTTSVTETVRYLGRESVTVPAGTFDTCKFETSIAGATTTAWQAAGNGKGALVKSSSPGTAGNSVLELKSGTINGSEIRP